MKRNVIHIFALISAISAGGVAHANSGYGSGHHELPDRNTNSHSAMIEDGGFEHLDRNNDSTVTRNEVAEHRQSMHANNMMRGGSMLPDGAGNDR